METTAVVFGHGCVVNLGDEGDELLPLPFTPSRWFWMTLDALGDTACTSAALEVATDRDNSLNDARRGNLVGADAPCCISG